MQTSVVSHRPERLIINRFAEGTQGAILALSEAARFDTGRTMAVSGRVREWRQLSRISYIPDEVVHVDLLLPPVPYGQHRRFWGRDALFKRPGTITVSYRAQIPAGLLPAEFVEAAEAAIGAEMAPAGPGAEPPRSRMGMGPPSEPPGSVSIIEGHVGRRD